MYESGRDTHLYEIGSHTRFGLGRLYAPFSFQLFSSGTDGMTFRHMRVISGETISSKSRTSKIAGIILDLVLADIVRLLASSSQVQL